MGNMADLGSFLFPNADQGRQPQHAAQIDWSNPLSSGLVDGFAAHGGTISLIRPISVVGALGYAPDVGGLSLTGWTTSNYLQSAFPGILGANPRTVLFVAYRDNPTISSSNATLLSYGNQTTSYARFTVRLNDSSSGGTVGALRVEIGNAYMTGSTIQSDKSELVSLITYPGGAFSNLNFYLSGQLEAISSSSGTINTLATDSSTPLTYGYATLSPARSWTGGMKLALMWNRVLSASEIASISENPWQLFASPSIGWPASSILVPLNALSAQSQAAFCSLSVESLLSGTAAARPSSDATLSASVALSGISGQTQAQVAALSVAAQLGGISSQIQQAAASIAVNTLLSGTSAQRQAASAALTVLSGQLQADPRFYVAMPGKTLYAAMPRKTFYVRM